MSGTVNAGEAVVRRNRPTARAANRHSFMGFESPSMIQARDAITDSPPSKPLLPDSYLLNAYNLSSTPTTTTLHPLIEDESPTSPLKGTKVSKALFEQTPGVEQLPDTNKEAIQDVAISSQSSGSRKENPLPNPTVKNQSQQNENIGAEKIIQREKMKLQSQFDLGNIQKVESVEQPSVVAETHPLYLLYKL